MPRSFNKEEEEQIQDRLMSEGKKLFATLGLKKTTVEDLCRAAGIAKGSFYKFHPSKEELYLCILECEEQRLRSSFPAEKLTGDSLNKEGLNAFFTLFIDFMKDDPLFLKMFSDGTLDLLMLKLPPGRVQQHMQQDEEWFSPLYRSWRQAGYLRDLGAEDFSALMRGVFVLFTRKNLIGVEEFDKVMRFVCDALADKIIRSREES